MDCYLVDVLTLALQEDLITKETSTVFLVKRVAICIRLFNPWTMSDMVKYRAAIWSFLKLTALYFTMSDIVHRDRA